jgi:hypothetical protein
MKRMFYSSFVYFLIIASTLFCNCGNSIQTNVKDASFSQSDTNPMPLVDTLKGTTPPSITSPSISMDTIFSDGVMVRIAIESDQTIIDWGNIQQQKRRVIVDTLLQDGDQSQIGNWTFFKGKTHYIVRLGENNNFYAYRQLCQ